MSPSSRSVFLNRQRWPRLLGSHSQTTTFCFHALYVGRASGWWVSLGAIRLPRSQRSPTRGEGARQEASCMTGIGEAASKRAQVSLIRGQLKAQPSAIQLQPGVPCRTLRGRAGDRSALPGDGIRPRSAERSNRAGSQAMGVGGCDPPVPPPGLRNCSRCRAQGTHPVCW